jgi:RNA polymerase sigma-70 factor (ECF subfamily)
MEGDLVNAFNAVYEKYYSLIVRVATGITGDPDVSEELSQEAFLRYYERIEKLPTGEEARYWLIRVIKNLCYNHTKRRGREYRAYHKYYHEPKNELTNEGEKDILKAESRQRVREALMEIPYKLRIVLVLKEYSGMNYKEIAKTLEISEGNVKIRVFRARKILAENLKKGDVYVP